MRVSDDFRELERRFSRRLIPIALDLIDEKAIETVPDALKSMGISQVDVLINNAGALFNRSDSLNCVKSENLRMGFEINVIGPMLLTRACEHLLKKSSAAKIVNITSRASSLTLTDSISDQYDYRLSKCAQNMFTRLLSIEYPWAVVFAVHPGSLKTELGGQNAKLEVMGVDSEITQLIMSAERSFAGCFLTREGTSIPW